MKSILKKFKLSQCRKYSFKLYNVKEESKTLTFWMFVLRRSEDEKCSKEIQIEL